MKKKYNRPEMRWIRVPNFQLSRCHIERSFLNTGKFSRIVYPKGSFLDILAGERTVAFENCPNRSNIVKSKEKSDILVQTEDSKIHIYCENNGLRI